MRKCCEKIPACLAAIMLTALGATAHAGQFNRVVDIGASMPDFQNLPATDGTLVSAADVTEDVLVLVFLACHCPWVQGMDPDLVQLVSEFEGKSVRFIGVSVNHRQDDRLPAMIEHAERNGYQFTYVFDESQELGRRLGATRTPEYFVFDKNRSLAYMGLIHNSPAARRRDGEIHYTNGMPTEFYLRDAVNAVLAGEPLAVPETRAHGCTVEYLQQNAS